MTDFDIRYPLSVGVVRRLSVWPHVLLYWVGKTKVRSSSVLSHFIDAARRYYSRVLVAHDRYIDGVSIP